MGLFKIMSNDALKDLKKADEPLYEIPDSTQHTIEIMKVSESGIFQITSMKYSKTYELTDINYVTCDDEERKSVLVDYCKILNSFENAAKITIVNSKKDMRQVRENILYKLKQDGLDSYRQAINDNIEEKMYNGKQGIEQRKFITITLQAVNFALAKNAFSTVEKNIISEFGRLNATLTPLTGNQRLTLIKSIDQMGEDDGKEINIKDYIKNGRMFENDICNSKSMVFPKTGTDFKVGNKFCEGIYISKYPNLLSDEFLSEIIKIPSYSVVSIDIVPIPNELSIKMIEKKYMGVENDIAKQQEKRNKNGNFTSEISYKKRKEKEDVEEMLDDVRYHDQRLFFVGFNAVVFADTKEERQSIVQTFKTIGNQNGCKFENQFLKQRECFNTVLPIGCRQVENMRTMLTRSVATLVPFYTQELEKDGEVIYYGINQMSKNVILGNRKSLTNANGWIFGVPGSGKSFDAKLEMACVYLGLGDDVIIIDPTFEYLDIVEKFNGSVVNLSTYTNNYINPLEIDLNIVDTDEFTTFKRDKEQFMLGLCSQCITEELNSHHRSIIGRCVRKLYDNILKKPVAERTVPILSDFRNVLLEQPEEEAADLALSLELFTEGALNIFNHQTNVNVDNQLVVYGIRDLGRELFPVAMLVMLEHIDKRISKNFELHKATWLYIDEIHEMLNKEYSAQYLYKCWKKHRKQGGVDTGITQNITDVLQSYTAQSMLSNSEFVMLLKQSATDADDLCNSVEGITRELVKFITNAPSGTGIVKHGSVIVPFDNRVEKTNPLYTLFNTNLHEKAEMEKLKKKTI